VAVRDQVSCELQGEAAILHLGSGIYYGLNRTGAWLWDLIQVPRTVAEIEVALVQKFDVEPERGTRDLHALLADLARERLIDVRDEPDP
jgi:hypothetical protein